MGIINLEEKEMIPLTNKEIKSYEKQKVCYICEKKFCDDKNKKSEYDLYHKEITVSILENLSYNVSKKFQ